MTHGGEIAFGPGEEFRFIRRLIRRFGSLAAGIGDDAALIHIPRDNMLAMTTDTAVDNVHFRRDWLTLDEIGYRAGSIRSVEFESYGVDGDVSVAQLECKRPR